MAKPKSALLSFDARGTLGKALTFQKRGQLTIAREKPIPAYRRTLPQVYQRWLYEDYAYLWTQQSEATRREYAAAGGRFHLTGFQYWMKYHLTNLPDIAGGWRLDEKGGITARDFSRNANHGTIVGATPSDGVIDGAFYFDGLNDYITSPYVNTLRGTVEFWTQPVNAAGAKQECFWGVYKDATHYFIFQNWNDGKNHWGARDGAVACDITTVQAFPSGYFLAHFDWDGSTGVAHLYWNNQLLGTTLTFPVLTDFALIPYIGARNRVVNEDLYLKGDIDNLITYNRVLDATERRRHLERRYP